MFNVGSVAVQPKLARLKRATQVSAFHHTWGALLRSGCPGRSGTAADGACGWSTLAICLELNHLSGIMCSGPDGFVRQ